MVRVLDRIALPRPLDRVAGPGLFAGCPGALFEIRDRALQAVPLPYPDCVPLAIDIQGRLIAGRSSGDRVVRRYRGRALDATYPFRIDDILSFAVSGDRGIVVRKDGRAIGLDESTVPRIDYSYRLRRRFAFVDATEDRVALSGVETIVCDVDGRMSRRHAAAPRVRFGPRGLWRIGDALRCGRHGVRPAALGLGEARDVLSGSETWALGEALVRFEL